MVKAEATVSRRQSKYVIYTKHWQDRADGARATAESFNDLDVKRALLRIAEGYDKMAKVATKFKLR